MPTFDAPGESIPCDRNRRVARRPIASAYHRPTSFRVGDFVEHALRRGGDIAWIHRAGRHHFLCRFSPMAAIAGDGLLPPFIVRGCTDGGAAPFRTAEYDQRRLLRDPCGAWCRFRNPDDRTLSSGAGGWRTASTGHC